MTRIPVEQVRVGKGLVPSPKRKFEDLAMCAKPGCEYLATDVHHLVRRSFLAGPYDLVEIDGVPRPNVCGLCHLCHHEITTNKAQILWDDQWVWCQTGQPLAPLDTGLGLEALPPLPLKEEVCVERSSHNGGDQNEDSFQSPLSEEVAEAPAQSDEAESRGRAKPRAQNPHASSESGDSKIEREPNLVERHPSHAPGVGTVGTEPSRSITPGSGATSSRQPDPGTTCPTCDRRVPHQATQAAPKTTKQLNLGHAPADVVPRLKDRLDDFALSAGITEKAYHRVRALDLLLIIAAQISVEALEGYAAHVDEELGWAA